MAGPRSLGPGCQNAMNQFLDTNGDRLYSQMKFILKFKDRLKTIPFGMLLTKNLKNKTKKVSFRCRLKDCQVFWRFEELSSAISSDVMLSLRHLQTACFRLKSYLVRKCKGEILHKKLNSYYCLYIAKSSKKLPILPMNCFVYWVSWCCNFNNFHMSITIQKHTMHQLLFEAESSLNMSYVVILSHCKFVVSFMIFWQYLLILDWLVNSDFKTSSNQWIFWELLNVLWS